MLLYGERCMFKPISTSKKKGDLDMKLIEGNFVGVNPRNGTLLFLTDRGLDRGSRALLFQ